MAKLNRQDFIFADLEGRTLVKKPGTIKGNGFVIERLVNCEVYILDHSSQVQVDDCVNCKIVIGPCDGSVFVRDSKQCVISAACRQFRTRDCVDMELSLYCATQPSIETSSQLDFSCWAVAYPNLTEHFQAANLDPLQNTWDKVFNFNAGDDDGDHYSVDLTPQPFREVQPEGVDGCCENPVPNTDGSLYQHSTLYPAMNARRTSSAGDTPNHLALGCLSELEKVQSNRLDPVAAQQGKQESVQLDNVVSFSAEDAQTGAWEASTGAATKARVAGGYDDAMELEEEVQEVAPVWVGVEQESEDQEHNPFAAAAGFNPFANSAPAPATVEEDVAEFVVDQQSELPAELQAEPTSEAAEASPAASDEDPVVDIDAVDPVPEEEAAAPAAAEEAAAAEAVAAESAVYVEEDVCLPADGFDCMEADYEQASPAEGQHELVVEAGNQAPAPPAWANAEEEAPQVLDVGIPGGSIEEQHRSVVVEAAAEDGFAWEEAPEASAEVNVAAEGAEHFAWEQQEQDVTTAASAGAAVEELATAVFAEQVVAVAAGSSEPWSWDQGAVPDVSRDGAVADVAVAAEDAVRGVPAEQLMTGTAAEVPAAVLNDWPAADVGGDPATSSGATELSVERQGTQAHGFVAEGAAVAGEEPLERFQESWLGASADADMVAEGGEGDSEAAVVVKVVPESHTDGTAEQIATVPATTCDDDWFAEPRAAATPETAGYFASTKTAGLSVGAGVEVSRSVLLVPLADRHLPDHVVLTAQPASTIISQEAGSDARLQWYASNTGQLASKDERERLARAELRAAAEQHLAKIKQERAKLLDSRKRANREAEVASSPTSSAQGKGHWENVTCLVDFKSKVPTSEVSRFRAMMLLAKTREQGQAPAV